MNGATMRTENSATEVHMIWLPTRSLTRSLPTLATAALLASGCGSPADSVAGASERVTTVPIKVEALIGYSYNITPVPGECVAPMTRRTGLDLTAGASNQEWASVVAEHCNSAAGAALGAGRLIAGGRTTVWDDEVWLSYTVATSGITVISTSPLTVRFEAPFHVTGGSGRFTNASGEGTLTCVRTTPVSAATLPGHTPAYSNYYECSLDGMISTVGQS